MSVAAARLDLSLIRVRVLLGRRVALIFGAIVVGMVFVFTLSWRAGVIFLLMGMLVTQGWSSAPTVKKTELMLVTDLVGVVVLWYVASDVAGIAFLTILVAVAGVFLVPAQRAPRLMFLALAAEGSRVLVYLVGASLPVVGVPDVGPIRVDFFVGAAARAAVIAWAVSGLARLLASFDSES